MFYLLRFNNEDAGASTAAFQRKALERLKNFSVGEIFSSAANFRHYDEWASTKKPKGQQLISMKVLCGLLDLPVTTKFGNPTIRTNVCGSILMLVSNASIKHLHQITFAYAKALSKYK